MNLIRHIRHLAGVLAGLACAWLGPAVAAPAAFAEGPPIPGPAGYITPGSAGYITPQPEPPVQVHTVVVGGMPGWQIALIAIGAALFAATAAVLVDRVWASRRKPAAAAA
jgi:hypothetical protein